MPLAPTPDHINSLLDYAEQHQIDVALDEHGRIRVHALQKTPEWSRFNKLFSNLVKQNTPLLKMTLMKRAHPAALDPPSPLGPIEGMIPSSGAGKMATAATIGADILTPELSIPAQLGIGAFAGITGELAEKLPAGKSPALLRSAGTGVISAGAKPALGGAVKGAKTIGRYFARPSELDHQMMWQVGKVVKDALGGFAPSANTIIADAGDFGNSAKQTVVRVLNSGEMQGEMGDFLNRTREGVIQHVQASADNAVANAAQQFQAKWGWDPSKPRPRGIQLTVPAKKMLSAFLDEKEHARVVSRDMRNAFDEVGALGRSIYERPSSEGGAGPLKHSYTAWKGANSIEALKQKIDDEVRLADPSGQLASTLEHASDQYAKFAGFRDFINTDNILYPNGKWLRADVAQKTVDAQTNPSIRFIQSRLKDAFKPLYDTVRRNAPRSAGGEPVISDRLLLEGLRTRVGGNLPLIGRVWSSLPTVRAASRFIGPDVEKGILRIPPQAAGKLPVLLNPIVTKAGEQDASQE